VKVRPGSLYHAVDRLTEGKLIRGAATTRDGKRPERAVYEITGAVHEFPQFAVALPEVHILGDDAAAAAVDYRVGPGGQQTDGVAV
jgi:hypothetical protein